ncbi:hypothetical protein RFI_11764 [Reticulomyxa filosa]|uniref:Uncharacterized protein n=1 Tax=Reticulomyxa filosa TaxID=46433 RepID=X6NHE2_RETFI|nr:hypothetical protein RFI_11764 [Reticulomyxa filosa]|eukprot:ETO25371.1 hypothetical protein RFI_11764 [Reticulomyxa filosa]
MCPDEHCASEQFSSMVYASAFSFLHFNVWPGAGLCVDTCIHGALYFRENYPKQAPIIEIISPIIEFHQFDKRTREVSLEKKEDNNIIIIIIIIKRDNEYGNKICSASMNEMINDLYNVLNQIGYSSKRAETMITIMEKMRSYQCELCCHTWDKPIPDKYWTAPSNPNFRVSGMSENLSNASLFAFLYVYCVYVYVLLEWSVFLLRLLIIIIVVVVAVYSANKSTNKSKPMAYTTLQKILTPKKKKKKKRLKIEKLQNRVTQLQQLSFSLSSFSSLWTILFTVQQNNNKINHLEQEVSELNRFRDNNNKKIKKKKKGGKGKKQSWKTFFWVGTSFVTENVVELHENLRSNEHSDLFWAISSAAKKKGINVTRMCYNWLWVILMSCYNHMNSYKLTIYEEIGASLMIDNAIVMCGFYLLFNLQK